MPVIRTPNRMNTVKDGTTANVTNGANVTDRKNGVRKKLHANAQKNGRNTSGP